MNVLGMFAKHWEPGRVKTRLAADIGPRASARVYHGFLETLVERFRGVADRRVLVATPPERLADFVELAGHGWAVESQGEGELGARLRRFFERSFRQGAERVVVLGSDSPSVPHASIDRALAQLEASRVVLGPAADGGYYLVAARHGVPPIFDAIPWSTSTVWAETIRCLERAAVAYEILPPWYDVDTLEDLNRLRRDLAGQGAWADRLAQRIDRALAHREDDA